MIRNRITELLGVEYPIVQAPMGWIARSRLASSVSNAGGLGIIETSSGELEAIRDEYLALARQAQAALRAREHPGAGKGEG